MIALITDFGTTDHFIGVVKGAIKKNIESKYITSYSNLKKDEIGIIYGSSQFIELTMNQDSIAEKYKIKLNQKIEIIHE